VVVAGPVVVVAGLVVVVAGLVAAVGLVAAGVAVVGVAAVGAAGVAAVGVAGVGRRRLGLRPASQLARPHLATSGNRDGTSGYGCASGHDTALQRRKQVMPCASGCSCPDRFRTQK
jgi:hypothetical protein